MGTRKLALSPVAAGLQMLAEAARLLQNEAQNSYTTFVSHSLQLNKRSGQSKFKDRGNTVSLPIGESFGLPGDQTSLS